MAAEDGFRANPVGKDRVRSLVALAVVRPDAEPAQAETEFRALPVARFPAAELKLRIVFGALV